MMDPATEKIPNAPDPRRRRRVIAVSVIGLAMCLRNIWLAAGGGGITPRPLLALETAAWAAAAVSGASTLIQPGDDTTRVGVNRLEQRAAVAFSVAAATHGFRVAVYMQRRASF